MTTLQINEAVPEPPKGLTPFALGFRPFFLLAGYGGLLLLTLWVGLWHAGLLPAGYYGAVGWHSHEMLFGYATAVFSGFLLTAVRNWTGLDTPTGGLLAALAALWLLPRILPWIPGLPGPLIAVSDLLFLPLLGLALWRPLWQGKNRVNRLFLPLLLCMTAANALVHAEALGWTAHTARTGTLLMLDLVVLLLLWISGRVIPFFVDRAVPESNARNRDWVERATYAGMLLLILSHLLDPSRTWSGWVSLAMAAVQAIRLAGWHHPGVWRIPILWVLILGYAWMPVAFLLQTLAHWSLIVPSPAIHAFTVGVIGTLTFGMMSRVILGHTGRSMQASRPMIIAFVLISLAALFRALGPALMPAGWVLWVVLGGVFWILAFAIFVAAHTRMLLRPRIDGQPG